MRYDCLQIWHISTARWFWGWWRGWGTVLYFGRGWGCGTWLADVDPVVLLWEVMLKVSLACSTIDFLRGGLVNVPGLCWVTL